MGAEHRVACIAVLAEKSFHELNVGPVVVGHDPQIGALHERKRDVVDPAAEFARMPRADVAAVIFEFTLTMPAPAHIVIPGNRQKGNVAVDGPGSGAADKGPAREF